MSQICSCNFEKDLYVGKKVKRGDPLGYFMFGGSDIVMIFDKSLECVSLVQNEHLLMGENYANLKIKN
ncbi:MAG: phosphatidylserine decarboxylase [Firmicutes bacterium]|nr:phosphatidylserine decarboxylase [Bacillota bacterium]